MKTLFNITLLVFTFLCLCIIAYVRLGIGFPIWHTENFQNFNIVIENLSYSFIAGVFVYLLTIVLPDWWEARRLKPIVDNKIIYLSVLFNKQLWGFNSQTNSAQKDNCEVIDCTKIEESLSMLRNADWNEKNPTVNIQSNKFYQTYKLDWDAIILEITDILQTYKNQLSQNDIQHLENIRQADFLTKLNILYAFNAVFPQGGQDFIVEGHRKALEEYVAILKDRKVSLD